MPKSDGEFFKEEPSKQVVFAPIKLTSPIAISTEGGSITVVLTPQIVQARQEVQDPENTSGSIPTQVLINRYLQIRKISLDQGKIAYKTWDNKRHFMTKWARFCPNFPWTYQEIDNYDLALREGHYHALRYLKTLSLWIDKRYPNTIPVKINLGTQRPPRHNVLTPDEEASLMDAVFNFNKNVWLFIYTLAHTGCRGFELSEVTWQELSEKGFGIITFRT